MVDDLKPYPAYKPSGVAWLGNVPQHWRIRRLKSLVSNVTEQANGADIDTLACITLEHVESWTGRIKLPNDRVTLDSQVKRFKADDILFGKLRPYLAKVTRPSFGGVCVGEFLVLRPNSPDLTSDYAELTLRSAHTIGYINSMAAGAKMPRTEWSSIGSTSFPLPPPDEQAAIVRFLDHIDARIRRYIQAKRRLIALLTEQKQALIHQAVTQGLDSSAPRKPSGVAWLGNIPAHWEVMKLRRLVSFNPSKSEINGLQDDASTVVFLPMEKVSEDGEIDCSEQRPVQQVRSGFPYFRRHDVIIAKITPCFENGKGAYLGSLVSEYGYGSTEFIVLRAGPRIDPQYAYLVSKSPLFRHLGKEAMTGAAGQQRVPLDFVKEFPVPLPPLSEQAGILKAVDDEQARIQLLINTARREIGLIREYRTRLIADVVTGQVNVRGVALPEIAELVPNAAEAWEEGESGEETGDEDDQTDQGDNA